MKLRALTLTPGALVTTYSGLASAELGIGTADTEIDDERLADGRAIFTVSKSF